MLLKNTKCKSADILSNVTILDHSKYSTHKQTKHLMQGGKYSWIRLIALSALLHEDNNFQTTVNRLVNHIAVYCIIQLIE